MLYFAKNEEEDRAKYMVTIDVWNFNIYWQNTVFGIILLSTFVFTVEYLKNMKLKIEADKIYKYEDEEDEKALAKMEKQPHRGLF